MYNYNAVVAGLDKLWTEEDYLSCWYADADAEMHPDYDRYYTTATSSHDALIRSRVSTRKLSEKLRHFNARTLGERRPSAPSQADIGVRRHSLVPESSLAAQIAMNDGQDSDPVQWQQGFTELRDSLIEHFNITWNARKVQWLSFPSRKQ